MTYPGTVSYNETMKYFIKKRKVRYIMAAISGTGVSLNSNYYLRNFYASNRNAGSSSKRKDLSKNTLSHADATALHRAAKKLRNFNYEDDSSDGANIYGSISAYIKTYNNALDSSANSSDASLERYSKHLKNLSAKYAEELEDIGITIEEDGSLKENENLLKRLYAYAKMISR